MTIQIESQHSHKMRTIESLYQSAKKILGAKHPPLLNISLDYVSYITVSVCKFTYYILILIQVVIDVLHLLLRISDVLINN